MADFLIELFCEEIPARMQVRGAQDLKDRLVTLLTEQGLAPASAEAEVTPRRLAFHLTGLATKAPDRSEEKRGPRTDAPQPAIDGFLRSTGLTVDQLERRQTDKGEMFFAVSAIAGRAATDILPGLIVDLILGYTWPKSMTWRDTSMKWVRPLRSIIALFDGKVLPGGLHLGVRADGGRQPGYEANGSADDLNYLPYGNITRGHRFLAPDAFSVTDWADYKAKLKAAKVVLSTDERKQQILDGAKALSTEVGGTLLDDPGLLDEVAGLVEWPVPLRGRIDDAFMDVPAEVLTTSMRSHQKYFAVRKSDGNLSPHFVVVANMIASDGGTIIIGGNERVLRARLSDAKFFWDQDRKKRLEDWSAGLSARIFHAKLGTVAERVERIAALAAHLAPLVGADAKAADRAARLAKADLSTGMVGEVPELQGVMGQYYAHHQGEAPEVAKAIAEHYSPLGPSDSCPTAPVSVAVALADKLDLLAGFFFINEKPTGSKDPFALRRAALGVLRILDEKNVRVPLVGILNRAVVANRDDKMWREYLGVKGEAASAEKKGVALAEFQMSPVDVQELSHFPGYSEKIYKATTDLFSFLADRLKVVMREKGVRHDLIQAVLELGGEDDIVRLLKRVDALSAFLASKNGADLLAGNRRAVNILKIEEKKDGKSYGGAIDVALLSEAPEQALAKALAAAEAAVAPLVKAEDYAAAMAKLGELRDPVDAFFTDVTVNADVLEVRANRLALLGNIRSVFGLIADFTVIEG
jgi:glycyl-tRNA synthetase beta chain